MKATSEEMASNRLKEGKVPSPVHTLVHGPLSIKLPEILEYLKRADFEHWLTAAFFENAIRMPLRRLCSDGDYQSEIRSVDVWMVEITQRTGKIWSGKVQAEITEVWSGGSQAELSTEYRYAEIFFALDTESGEFAFRSENLDGSSKKVERQSGFERNGGLGHHIAFRSYPREGSSAQVEARTGMPPAL
jgi:hypothetical protein